MKLYGGPDGSAVVVSTDSALEKMTKDRDRWERGYCAMAKIAGALFAKHGGECHHCGVESLSLCPHGFPGCHVADDILWEDKP